MRHDRRRAGRITQGTFASVIRAYQKSPTYAALASATRRIYGMGLRHAENPDTLGGLSVEVIRPSLVQAFLDGLAHTPGAQKTAKTALKAVEKWALVRDLLPYPIMTGTSVVKSDGGFEPWTDEQVALAEKHARPDLSRVITLAVHTGQRGSDIVRMRWSDLRVEQGRLGISVTQKKTGVQLWVPLTQELQAAMETWERRPTFIVLKPDGTPYSREMLSWHWYKERATNDRLKALEDARLVLHGLRATAVVRLRKAGARTLQIADMIGMSEPMVARYSRLADKVDRALAAVHFLDRTGDERRAQTEKKTKL
jgi:integrase